MCNIYAIGDHFQLRRNSRLRKLQLSGIQLIISSLLLNQIRMIPAFNDLSMIKHNNCITVSDRRQTMGDNKNRTTFHQVIHTFLHNTLGTGIDAGRCFIEDENRWICHGSSCDRKQLALSLGQFFTIAAEHGIIAIWKHLDKLVSMRQFCRLVNLFICRVKISVTDVVTDGSSKQVSILQYNTEGTTQIVFFNLCNIDAVIADFSLLNIVETVDQVGNCCLSGTGRANKCQFLSRFCEQADIF